MNGEMLVLQDEELIALDVREDYGSARQLSFLALSYFLSQNRAKGGVRGFNHVNYLSYR